MADPDDAALPRVLTLLWGRDEPARRGPKPAHNIHDIGAAAVRVANAAGLVAVSMSRVAKELGVTTMALYRYVDSKDDLYLAMLDTAYGQPNLTTRTAPGWRARLDAWARANREVLARHPWMVQVRVAEPPLGPNQLQWMEAGLDALAGTRLSEQEKLSSLLLVDVFVRGQTQLLPVAAVAGQDPEVALRDWAERYVRRLALLVDEQSMPAVHAAVVSGAMGDDGDFAQDEFDFGLRTVLDGIAAGIDRRKRAVDH